MTIPTTGPRLCPGRDCGAEIRNGFLCKACVAQAVRALDDLPFLAAELETTIARQDRGAAGGTIGKGGESKLPINLGAMAERNAGQLVIAFAWEVGYRPRPVTFDRTIAAIKADPSKLQFHPAGPELARTIHRTVSKWRNVIDQNQETIYAGPCNECGTDMHARVDSEHVSCPNCRRRYNTRDQDDWVISQVRDWLWPINEIRTALGNWLGLKVSDSTVRSWRRRGQLVPHGRDLQKNELYRVGDYLALAEGLKATKESA